MRGLECSSCRSHLNDEAVVKMGRPDSRSRACRCLLARKDRRRWSCERIAAMQFLTLWTRGFAAAHWAKTFCLVVLLAVSTPALLGQAPESIRIVKQFITPGASIAPLHEWSPTSGAVVKTTPAVFESVSVLGGRPDLVFAEDAKLDQGRHHVLTVCVLRLEKGVSR